jgi:hypothetical protein
MPLPCPHCQAVADVTPSAALGFCCVVCGGPRLSSELPQAEPPVSELLESAGRQQTKHLMFSAAGAVLLGMGALALVVVNGVVAVAAPGTLPSLAAYAGASVPTLSGIVVLVGAAKARTLRARALRDAEHLARSAHAGAADTRPEA